MNSTNSKSSDKSSAEAACCMAFTPQSSPTRGGEVMFITYSDDFPLPDHGDFYVVFEGKKQRHVTTAQQLNTYTLRAVVPDHDQAERVSLTVYCAKDSKLGTLSSHKFLYLLETDQIIAQVLTDNAGNSQLFECLASLSAVANNMSKDFKDSLDSGITNAFEFLRLSPSWTLFGEGAIENSEEKNGQETLLHLSARFGFTRLASYLLDQPGSEEALGMYDKLGKSPEDIAREKGMKHLADMLSKGPGPCKKRSPKDLTKPVVRKTEIGTTSISRHKNEEQCSLEKDIERLEKMNSLVEDEMKRRIPKFRHSWPVRRKVKDTTEDVSSSDEELKQINRDHMARKYPSQLNSVMPGRTGATRNRHLLEQKLQRLRDINEEIQKLRMTNVQRGLREGTRGGMQGRHVRRLSCPSLIGPDLVQSHLMAGIKPPEDEKPTLNGTMETNEKNSKTGVNVRTSLIEESTSDKSEVAHRHQDYLETTNSDNLSGSKSEVVMRSHSWRKEAEEKPELQKKVSSSLNDLTKDLKNDSKSENENAHDRTEAISGKRPASLHLESPKEENNKLVDILDSIKKASDVKSGMTKSSSGVSITSLTDVDLDVAQKAGKLLNPSKSNLHTKSYSYSCLANLKLGDDGEPVDAKTPGAQSNETPKKTLTKRETTMSLMDFLNDEETQEKAENRLSLEEFLENPDDSADDSEELDKGYKPEGKGLRRLSMLFGSKSSKPSKRELPRLQKTGVIRSSLRKDKGLPITNLRNKEEDSKKDVVEKKESKEPVKTALGRRASGVNTKNFKPKEPVAVLPNPSLLTRTGKSGTLPSRSHLHTKPTSPLPFRSRSFTATEDDSKEKEKDKDREKEKSSFGVSPEVSGDDEEDDEGEIGLELQDDPDLEIREEPEAWSITVDKKVLRRMNAKDIKRQDVIHELIQTEIHHVRTLKIMQKIFYHGMLNHVGMAKETVDQILPRLDDLLQINGDFLNRLKASESEDSVVNSIGDVLEQQFSGENSGRMKSAYGEFCSNHIEAVELYKKMLRTDKKFADFIKKCNMNKRCRRLSIPECITLITQRLTKYPMLIEAIVKTTRESKPDFKSLNNSISLVKEVLQSVDKTIKEHEKEKTLQDMKMKLDLKVTVTYKGGNKVKNIDFASNTSKLLQDGNLLWKSARGKLTETRVLVLEDMLVFLQEKDQKYSLLSLDQKAPVIRLCTLMVREVATDLRAIFLVSTSPEGPEMYEMVCESPKDKKQWIECIREAIASAPKDGNQGDGLITTRAGERLKIVIRRANVLIEQVQNKDMDKGKHLAEMQELVSQIENMEKTKLDSDKAKELSKAKESLVVAVQQVQSAVSSEEHSSEEAQSDTQGSAFSLGIPGGSGPKRAETFSGFDSRLKPDSKDVYRASSMRTERPGLSFPSRQIPGSISPVAGGSPKIKHKRRPSGGGWSFLKSSNKDEKDQSASTGDVGSDSPSSSPSHTPTPSPSPGQEQEVTTDSDSGAKSARFRPVKERSDGSPTRLSRSDAYHGRRKHNLREQVQHLSPRTQRQTNTSNKGEEDKERENKDKSPDTTQEVIYF